LDDDLMLAGRLADRQLPVLAVVTKVDKLSRDRAKRKAVSVQNELGAEVVTFSAVTGEGKKELMGAVSDLVARYYHRRRE
ncbi:MAG: hypothetical protein AB1744_09450, partial [Candidatus Zixiibacteriota bacterium]